MKIKLNLMIFFAFVCVSLMIQSLRLRFENLNPGTHLGHYRMSLKGGKAMTNTVSRFTNLPGSLRGWLPVVWTGSWFNV